MVGSAAPAAAHDELISTDPAAGATVDALPTAITLTYSAQLLAEGGGNEVQVTDAEGTSIADGALVVDGATVTQALLPGATGAVTVLWRVVSSDGHPISGEFSFTVADASPAPSPTDTVSPSPTATSYAPTQTSTATPEPAPTGDGGTALPWIVLAIVVVAAGGAVLFVLIRRARQNRDGGGRPGDSGPASGR